MESTTREPDYIWHGFVLSDGVFTTVDFPGQEQAGNYLSAISDNGEAVGFYNVNLPIYNGSFSVTIKHAGKK